jgi:hypothetical protein
VELEHLTDLGRLERTAVEVDGLTAETAGAAAVRRGGMDDVAAELVGVRQAMTDLLDVMTRTRAPSPFERQTAAGGAAGAGV